VIILAVLILAAISGCVILCFTFSSEEVGLARIALGMQASLAGITSVALAFFVAGPDDYRADGTSRWDAYGAQGLTVTAVVVGVAVAVIALVLFVWPRRRFSPLLGLAGIAAAVLIFCAFFANSLN
jgi:hypothetical protein